MPVYLCTKYQVCNICNGYPLTVNFCCLLKFISISSVHGAFSLSFNVHAQSIGTQTLLLKRSFKSFDTGMVKKLRKCQYWAIKSLLIKNVDCGSICSHGRRRGGSRGATAPLAEQNSATFGKFS